MNDPEKSEAAEGATSTTSESHSPTNHDEAEESADNVANPVPEGKDDNAIESPGEGDEGEQGDIAVEQGSNPVSGGGIQADPDGHGSEPAGAEADDISEPPKKGKRGRPPGIKNGAGKKKPSSKKLARSAPKTEPSAEAKEPPAAQAPPAPQTAERAPLLQWIDRDKLVRGEPFSTLLPIRPETYEAIKASMLAKGFDPTHPAHVWDRDGLFTLVDGYTRDKAAGEVGITLLLAFVHHFQDETAALGFAIQCQTARRNITDGEMFVLVGVYDKKVKPGSTQQRQEGGTFAPRASTDALGKSSKKTGDVLNTSATTVDRVRYLHKHADASTKAAVTNNKVTLSRACETVRKKLAAAAKAAKIHPETNGDAPKEKLLAFDATPESDIAFAAWHPVVRREPALSADIEDEAQAKREVGYVLVEELLDLPASLKDLGAPANHRVLVSPQFDLFADEVPAKTVRKVLHTAAEAKKFDFLFTTRNPERLQEFSWEMNTFAGVSIFGQNEVAAAEDALLAMDGLRKWLVIEQLTMELTFKHLDQLDWLVVREGAGVPSAALDPYALKSLLQQAWTAKCPVLFERGVIYRPMDAPKATQGVADKATVQTKSATTGDGEQNRE